MSHETRVENFFPDELYEAIQMNQFVYKEQSTHRSNGVTFSFPTGEVMYILEEEGENILSIQIRPTGVFTRNDVDKMEEFCDVLIDRIIEASPERLRYVTGDKKIQKDNACIYINEQVQWSIFAVATSNPVFSSYWFYENKNAGGAFNPEHSDIPAELKQYYDEQLRHRNSNDVWREYWESKK